MSGLTACLDYNFQTDSVFAIKFYTLSFGAVILNEEVVLRLFLMIQFPYLLMFKFVKLIFKLFADILLLWL